MAKIINLPNGRGKGTQALATVLLKLDKAKKKLVQITEAWRSRATQEGYQRRWRIGGKYNRPPYLYQPDMTPPYEHEKGTVFDSSDRSFLLSAAARALGIRQPFAYDLVHYEYFSSLDLSLRKPVPPKKRLLRLGSRGADVKVLQKKLGGLVVDGIFGRATRAKVIAFQKKHKLVADGVVGPVTRRVLGI